MRDSAGVISSVACYAQDLTEKIRFTRQLQEQNKQLRDIAWLQSHGVRAPLARFMSLVEVLSEEVLEPAERREYLDYAQQAAQELDAIIGEISEKARAAEDKDERGA